MKHKRVVLGCLGILVMMTSAQADIVALKRDATLAATNRLDSRFATAITNGTIVMYSGAGRGGRHGSLHRHLLP